MVEWRFVLGRGDVVRDNGPVGEDERFYATPIRCFTSERTSNPNNRVTCKGTFPLSTQ